MAQKYRFWDATIEELCKGYVYESSTDDYICLLCNKSFENGVIYPIDNVLYEAKKAIGHHIKEVHGSTFDYLIQMDKKYTGLSEHQKELLQFFKNGVSDKEIATETGGSNSTIRNHRFKFREKEKQAKVFLAIMNLLKKDEDTKDSFIDIHKGAKMVDERYAITTEEKERVLSTYFDKGLDGPLKTFPSKEKRKIIVLQHLLKSFEIKSSYSEMEVNEILKKVYSDFVTIRRYFIEYGFMERSKDGSKYWVKN
ncbi:DUF2087 domain-containing protein [Oceanobacillus bengalensis]|uniref:DUF2087 domain-containing protein n=1 Tax=Oceanobacillus bengalensis TaxID=1435466 RepID=A0A494YZ52_9BACI|nr:DUF2087 domain-containing protein [Oceanobacillus bengalensis]RKQ15509.1 DUF2087 domain-containing protein [Oceanobacillus bengalensis]